MFESSGEETKAGGRITQQGNRGKWTLGARSDTESRLPVPFRHRCGEMLGLNIRVDRLGVGVLFLRDEDADSKIKGSENDGRKGIKRRGEAGHKETHHLNDRDRR